MRKLFAISAALATLILFGCDAQQWFNSFIPKEQAAIGQRYLEDVRTRNFQPVKNRIDPAYKSPSLDATLAKMAALFPSEKPLSIKVVGSNTVTSSAGRTYNLTYEYQFPRHWALGHIYFKAKGNDIQIGRMDVYQLRASLEQSNAFTLVGKTPIQYLILLLAIMFPVFTIATVIVCVRTPVPKRKWLWIVFILLGVGSVALNWTSGQIRLNPFSLVLFGASYFQNFYGPVIIQIGLPLGAVLFWARRKRWKGAANAAADAKRIT